MAKKYYINACHFGNIFVIGPNMAECTAEEIAREAAMKIAEITDKLIEKQNDWRQEKP